MNPTPSTPQTSESAPNTWVWPILLVAIVAATLLRLVTPQLGLFNFSMVGAMALFAGARLRTPLACLVPLLVMVVSDLLLWQIYQYQPFNLVSYFAYCLYAALGFLWSRPDRMSVIIGGPLTGSLVFFLLTNGAVWWASSVNPALLPEGAGYVMTMQGSEFPYPRIEYARNLSGLIACYWLALPFYGYTLASDVLFVAGLFGAEALLLRYAPAGLRARREQS